MAFGAGLGVLVPSTAATAAPELPAAPTDEREPPSSPEDRELKEIPPLQGAPESTCDPACPEGALCHAGQCFAPCDPAVEDCGWAPAEVAPAVEPSDLQPQPGPPRPVADDGDNEGDGDGASAGPEMVPAPAVEPEVEPEPEPEVEPEPDLTGLSIRIAPIAAACLGSGCRRVQVGSSGGGIGLGGGLDLRLAYRATSHLSLEVGGLLSIHGNDIDAGPLSMALAALAGPRLHLSGGRWRAEPVVGMQVGYVHTLVRWTNAGTAADGLVLGTDLGVQMQLSPRISLGMLGGLLLPYWTRVCEASGGTTDCHRRSELTTDELRRFWWTTSLALVVHFN